MVLQLLNDGVVYVAQLLGYGPLRPYEERERRARHNLPVAHLHGGDLHNVVMEHVEPRCLGVKHHQLALPAGLHEVVHIGAAV